MNQIDTPIPTLESIEVTDFLVLKKIKLEIRDLTILIGEQGSGKSIISKLISFCRRAPEETAFYMFYGHSINNAIEKLESLFCSIFPKIYWQNQNFLVSYKTGSYKIEIRNIEKSLNIVISHETKSLIERAIGGVDQEKLNQIERSHLDLILRNVKETYSLKSNVFIPASRSFYTALSRSIITIAKESTIEKDIAEFSQLYSQIKFQFKDNKTLINQRKNLRTGKIAKKVIPGRFFVNEDLKEFIINGKSKIQTKYLSSGQQEILPIALTMQYYEHLSTKEENKEKESINFIIEEPEANLFPTSQALVCSMISILLEKEKHNSKFFITTHSPYIISAFNNLIIAYDAVEKNKITINKLKKINGDCEPIRYERVSAYAIKDGELLSLLNENLRMISGKILDETSKHFIKVMDELI